jgi:hypothetical protein
VAALVALHVGVGGTTAPRDPGSPGTTGAHASGSATPTARSTASPTAGRSGGYPGTWHEDLSGNQVPDDCRAWAASSSNPMSRADGLDLCHNGG